MSVHLRSRGIGVCVNSLIVVIAGFGDVASVLDIWHQVAVKHMAADADIVNLKAPVTKVLLSIVENLACLVAMVEHWTGITWDNWSVIEKVQEATSVASEDDLLLSTLDGSSKFSGICLLELLSGL